MQPRKWKESQQWNSNFFTFKAGETTIDYRECGANGAAMRVLPTVESYKDLNFLIPEINAEIPGGHI